MSWQAVEAVFRGSKSKGTARLVLLAIAHHAGPDLLGARPSVPTLAQFANITPREVSRYLRELEGLGELLTEVGGGRKANQYTILLPQLSHVSLDTPDSGSIGQEVRAAMSPQTGETALNPVVDVVGLAKQNSNPTEPDPAWCLAALEREGVRHKQAVAVISKPEWMRRVPQQLLYLDFRNADSRPAILVRSIKENWGPPASYLKHIEEQRKAEETRERQQAERDANRKREQEQEAAKQREAEELERQQAEGLRLDAAFEALPEAKRDALDREVSNRLGMLPPMMQTELARRMMRRELLAEQEQKEKGNGA